MDSPINYATEQAAVPADGRLLLATNYELESAESQVRLDFTNDWDEQDGPITVAHPARQNQVPGMSRRLNLVFSDEAVTNLT